MKKYILKGTEVVEASLEEWAKMFEGKSRVLAKDVVGDAEVSTVFLGLDHSYGSGPPLVFETMIFGGRSDQYQRRASTWNEAMNQHQEAIHLLLCSQ